jgi:LacI family transcriptional regulator
MTRTATPPPTPLRYLVQDGGPAYLGVKRALLERIARSGRAGDRLPPIRELAQEMAVSPNNVQLAVRELVGEGVLFSRKRLGLFVRSLPERRTSRRAARELPMLGRSVTLVSNCIPVVPFIQRMMQGFEQVLREAGAQTQRLAHDPEVMALPAPDSWGVALFNPNSAARLSESVRHAVVVSTADHINADLVGRYDRVGVDQQQGGMLAGRVLRSAGCGKACFLGARIANGTRRYDQTSSSRLHGFEVTWGGHLEPERLLYTPGYSLNSGALGFNAYARLDPRPTGVFAADDDLALGFMAAATGAGLLAGRDFQIVGFDGQDTRASVDARLTTIRVPDEQMGRLAAQLMIQRVQDPSRPLQRVSLPCSVVRGDTACPQPV